MSTLKEILPIEDNRQDPQTWNKIHLFKQGDFWHAYDWSAWLICRVVFADEVKKYGEDYTPLKVKRMERTDVDGSYCTVGFPIKSLGKYVPVREDFVSDGDAHLIITIKLPKLCEEVDYERMKSTFQKWMGRFDMQKKKSKNKKPTLPASASEPSRVGGLIVQIMQYPLSERNGMENIQFIQKLKDMIASIL